MEGTMRAEVQSRCAEEVEPCFEGLTIFDLEKCAHQNTPPACWTEIDYCQSIRFGDEAAAGEDPYMTCMNLDMCEVMEIETIGDTGEIEVEQTCAPSHSLMNGIARTAFDCVTTQMVAVMTE